MPGTSTVYRLTAPIVWAIRGRLEEWGTSDTWRRDAEVAETRRHSHEHHTETAIGSEGNHRVRRVGRGSRRGRRLALCGTAAGSRRVSHYVRRRSGKPAVL